MQNNCVTFQLVLIVGGFLALWIWGMSQDTPKRAQRSDRHRPVVAPRLTKANQVQILEDELEATFGVPVTLEEVGLDPNNPPRDLSNIDMTAIYARCMDDEDA